MPIPSGLQKVAVAQLAPAFVGFVDAMSDYFAANPTATQAQASAYLTGLAYPDPSASIQFSDRAALFTYLMNQVHPYEGKATAYLSLRQLLLDHPKAIIRVLDKDAGRVASTKAEILYRRCTGFQGSDWPRDGEVTGHSTVRDPAKGNYQTSETWTLLIGATTYNVRKNYTVTSDGNGGWVSTPGSWEMV